MDLLNPANLTKLCTRAGMRPQRASGQHFLINRGTRDAIIDAVDPQPSGTIMEIGAGFGVLTAPLAPRVRRVIAIERDRRITPILRECADPYGDRVHIVEGDILRLLQADALLTSAAIGKYWTMVANLPYGITSEFLRLLFDRIADGTLPPPERMVFLLQREVVDRMTGADGARGFLTIATALHGTARRIARVPPSHFWPSPRVESAVVAMTEVRSPSAITERIGGMHRATFLRFVHRCCSGNRRRQIGSVLTAICGRDRTRAQAALAHARVEPARRPDTLTLDEWIALARALSQERCAPPS